MRPKRNLSKRRQKKTEKEESSRQAATLSIGAVNNLLSGDRYKAIAGVVQTGSIPFFGDRAAVAEYKQLKASLALGARSLIKGSGAVSDFEARMLQEASSALSRTTNEGQMKQALQTVRGVLKTNNGQETEVIIKDKKWKGARQRISERPRHIRCRK